MLGIEFHRTEMGRRFFEATLPQLVLEMGRIGEHLGAIHRLVARALDERSVPRRRVLIVHDDLPALIALDRVLRIHHDVCIARTYDVARELIELFEFDTLIICAGIAWARPGTSLVEHARVVRPEALCVALSHGNRGEREALVEQRGIDAALDGADFAALLRELKELLR